MGEALTETKIREMMVPEGKRLELADAGCKGLRLRASANDRTFYYVGGAGGDGKVRRVKLGRWPAMRLATARRRADEIRAQLADGEGYRTDKGAKLTFQALADRYLTQIEGRKRSWKLDAEYLKRASAELGSRNAARLSRADFAELLNGIAKSAPTSANRMQSVLRTMLGHAVDDGLLAANPLAGARKFGGRETPKDRVLSDDELRTFWRALDDEAAPAIKPIRLALKTILLTAARPGEVATLMRNEIVRNDRVWTIPREKAKNGRTHIVPLSPAALDAIDAAIAETDTVGAGEAVFVSRYESTAPIARHSLSQATRRLCTQYSLARFSPHDLRRTAATLARAEGAPRDAVKALLNHTFADVTSRYDRHSMLEEKRDAVERIERRILRIVAADMDRIEKIVAT